MVEMEVVGLAAILVTFKSPPTIRSGMVLDARGRLSDAQYRPCSLRRVPAQSAVGVHVLGDVDDFGRVNDRPLRHFYGFRAEPSRAGEVGLARPMGDARRAAHPKVGDAPRMPGQDAVELRPHRRETCRSGKLH